MIKNLILLITAMLCSMLLTAQHATGDKTTQTEFKKVLRAPDRATRDLAELPAAWSLKKYAPTPGNQGLFGTCVAWSSAYGARTISYAIHNKLNDTDEINQHVFSPGYLYYKIKHPTDADCSKGSNITEAMRVMSKTGVMLKKEGPTDCTETISAITEISKADPYKIKDYVSINDNYGTVTKEDVLKIKKSLSENKPVVISLKCYHSLFTLPASGIWTPAPNDVFEGNHALCVVGYDDEKNGGSFEIMNSWGTSWANMGFFWLSYEQMIRYGNYAVEMMDFETEKPKLSGNFEFIKLDETEMLVERKKVNTRSIIVEDDDKADYSLYKFIETYPGGTAFKIKFSTNAPSYIYVFGEDDKGDLSRLFPYSPAVSAAVNSANATYYLPSESKHARLSMARGKENICVLYSKSEIDFEGLMEYIGKSKSSIYEAVKDKLGDRLLDLKKVKFEDDKIAFEAPAEGNAVLCFFIELEHK